MPSLFKCLDDHVHSMGLWPAMHKSFEYFNILKENHGLESLYWNSWAAQWSLSPVPGSALVSLAALRLMNYALMETLLLQRAHPKIPVHKYMGELLCKY